MLMWFPTPYFKLLSVKPVRLSLRLLSFNKHLGIVEGGINFLFQNIVWHHSQIQVVPNWAEA